MTILVDYDFPNSDFAPPFLLRLIVSKNKPTYYICVFFLMFDVMMDGQPTALVVDQMF